MVKVLTCRIQNAILLSVVCALAFSLSCVAYAQTGSVSGRVTDPDGKPVRNATVQVLDQWDQVIASNKSQADGVYLIAGVSLRMCQVINKSCKVAVLGGWNNDAVAMTNFHFAPNSTAPVVIDLRISKGGFILTKDDPHTETSSPFANPDVSAGTPSDSGENLKGQTSDVPFSNKVPRTKNLPPDSERWALVIGVSRYDDPRLNPLFGQNDAKTIAADLQVYAGFSQDHVFLLTDDQSMDRQPKRERILYWLSILKQNASPQGLILIAFSGHGIENNGETFLMAKDSYLNFDATYLREGAINVDSITTSLRDSQAAQVILFLDACRSNPYATKGVRPHTLTRNFVEAFDYSHQNLGKEAFATIFATGLGGEAYQYQEKKMGCFTWTLHQAFTRGTYDSSGQMTLAALISYLDTNTPRTAKLSNPGRLEQKPYALIEGYLANQLVFAHQVR